RRPGARSPCRKHRRGRAPAAPARRRPPPPPRQARLCCWPRPSWLLLRWSLAPAVRLEQVALKQGFHAVAPALVGVAADADARLLQEAAAGGVAHRHRDVEDEGRNLVDEAADRALGAQLAG